MYNNLMLDTLLFIILVILTAIAVDNIFRYFIKVPKRFDSRRSRTYTSIFRNLITVAIYAIALYLILLQFKINITTILASAGIAGLAIGLGAKTLIEDVIAGISLQTQDSIVVGDVVKIDDAEGTIEQIGFRTLTLRAENNSLHIIPNGQIKKVINFSRHKVHHFVTVSVKIDKNIDQVLKIFNEALSLLEKDETFTDVLYSGSQVDGIEDFRSEGTHMLVRTTLVTHPAHRLVIARKFRFLLKKEFEKNKLHLG